jgi:hypothetical protein
MECFPNSNRLRSLIKLFEKPPVKTVVLAEKIPFQGLRIEHSIPG